MRTSVYEVVAVSCADHDKNETGYVKFLKDVPYGTHLYMKLPKDEIKEHNKKVRASVDKLLAEAGFSEDCSIRNQLACMNFD